MKDKINPKRDKTKSDILPYTLTPPPEGKKFHKRKPGLQDWMEQESCCYYQNWWRN